MRKLLKKHGRAPRVLITDKLKSYAAANREPGLHFEHRQHKGLNNRAENSHQAKREARTQAFTAWERVSCAPMMAFLASRDCVAVRVTKLLVRRPTS